MKGKSKLATYLLLAVMVFNILGGAIPVQAASGSIVDIATVPAPGQKLEAKYSFMPVNIQGVTVFETFGGEGQWKENLVDGGSTFTGIVPTEAMKNNVGVIYRNVGNYEGRTIDLKVTIHDWEQYFDSRGAIGFRTNGRNLAMTTQGYTWVDTTWEFLDAVTGMPAVVGGYLTFDDIDYRQGVTFNQDTTDRIEEIFIAGTDNTISYSKTGGELSLFDAENRDATGADDTAAFTIVYQQSSVRFKWTKVYTQAKDSRVYDPNDLFGTYVGERMGVPTRRPLAQETTKPTKFVDGQNSNTLPNRDEEFTYTIYHGVPWENSANYYTSYEMKDTLPSCLEVQGSVSIINKDLVDVTDRFNVNITGSVITATAKSETLAASSFYENTYKFVIDVKIKDGIDLSAFYNNVTKQVVFTNKATVSADGETPKESNVVTTNVNITEDSTPIKKIKVAGSLLDETNVNVTPTNILFRGTTTITDLKPHTSIKIVDELDEHLTFKSLKVYLADDTEITSHGTLNVNNNTIEFDFNSAYLKSLMGQTIYFELETTLDSYVEGEDIKNTFDVITEEGTKTSGEVKVIVPKVNYTVTTTTEGNGTAGTDKPVAKEGETVTITATPDPGSKFVRWEVVSGDVTLTDPTNPSQNFIMPDENVVVKAIFEEDEPEQYTVTTTTEGNGTAGTDKPVAEEGEIVTITATPDPDNSFVRWEVVSGDVTLTDPTNPSQNFIMPDENVVVKAIFEENEPEKYTVTTTTEGNGTASTDKPIAEEGETVALNAIPGSDSHFVRWEVISGDVTLTDPTNSNQSFIMPDENVVVKAVFETNAPNEYSTTVIKEGNGTGTVDIPVAEEGETITITATPDPDNSFVRWEVIDGDVTLTDPTNPNQSFIMPDENVVVKAIFEEDEPEQYTVTTTTEGNGTADTDKPVAKEGETVTLTATPGPDNSFVRWEVISGDVTLTDPTNPSQSFVMPDENVVVKAIFKEDEKKNYTVTTTTEGKGSGKVNIPVAEEGETVTITATPDPGSKFVRWEVVSGDVTLTDPTNPSQTFVMPGGDLVVRAVFEEDTPSGNGNDDNSGNGNDNNSGNGNDDNSGNGNDDNSGNGKDNNSGNTGSNTSSTPARTSGSNTNSTPTGTSTGAKTGDTTMMAMWTLVLSMAVLTAGAMIWTKKKKCNNDQN